MRQVAIAYAQSSRESPIAATDVHNQSAFDTGCIEDLLRLLSGSGNNLPAVQNA